MPRTGPRGAGSFRRSTGRAAKASKVAERVVAAMSGGVDSSVAALLLREAGCEVVGVFLENGVGRCARCCSLEDAADARTVARRLGIPFHALDCGEDFARLADFFVESYCRGTTPSPCVLCNEWIKFGKLAEFAREIGASAIATGHYARLERLASGRRALRRGVDRAKDQSYFLGTLTQDRLAGARLPLGSLRKEEVRTIARRAGLEVAEKPESMEICFVPGDDYRRLIEERRPGSLRPGELADETGRVIGRHPGFQCFTVGQRSGLGIALGYPAYVTAIDPEANRVIVGPRASLARSQLTAEHITWVSREPPRPEEPFRCLAQVRSRHTAAPATAWLRDDGRLLVRFDRPVEAIAPGQACVLYDGDLVLAGGWISRDR